MLKIRLLRTGTRKKPKYRVVVAEESAKRNGKYTEIIGHYDPMTNPPKIELKKDRYTHWSGVGAVTTKAVADLFKRYEKINRVSS